MIPSEVLAAWAVAVMTGATALGGLSLFDSPPSAGGMEAEPLPFHYADTSTARRLLPLNPAWRSRLEATGSLPARPVATPVEWADDDDQGDEIDQHDKRDEPPEGPLAAAYNAAVFLSP